MVGFTDLNFAARDFGGKGITLPLVILIMCPIVDVASTPCGLWRQGDYAPASAFLETLLNKGTARCGLQVSLKARSANSIANCDISFEAPRFP